MTVSNQNFILNLNLIFHKTQPFTFETTCNNALVTVRRCSTNVIQVGGLLVGIGTLQDVLAVK